MTRRDVNDVLSRGARMPNGRYRVLVSRFADGAPLGNFRYYGTRPDDPNDIIPHEDRRELRAARVFGAWLNHDDSRGVNSLDMLQTDGGRRYVKHYMFDFGSIMGSGTVFAQRHRAGNEYIIEWAPGWLTLATLGLYTRDWLHIDYPDVPPSVGRFEGHSFDPLKWRPEYPNTAFDNMRADDAFWAARIVAKFSDADIRAIVSKARYSDPRATDYITATLIERRNKVLKTWLTAVNPLVDFALIATADSPSPTRPSLRAWRRPPRNIGYDGPGSTMLPVLRREPSKPQRPELRVAAPPQVLAEAEFVQVEIESQHPQFSAGKLLSPCISGVTRPAGTWLGSRGPVRMPGRHCGSLSLHMPERRRLSRSEAVAVIDIGSNSGRVMVFERDASNHLRLLAGSRAPLRLVHDVDQRAELSEATMARTMEALRDFQAIAESAGPNESSPWRLPPCATRTTPHASTERVQTRARDTHRNHRRVDGGTPGLCRRGERHQRVEWHPLRSRRRQSSDHSLRQPPHG